VSVVHRTYARALYDAAREAGRTRVVRDEVVDFVEATRQVPELRELLRNPQVDPRAKASAVEAVLGQADPLVRNFLRLLVEKGRAADLDEIGEELSRLVDAEERRVTVELTTAVELSDDEVREILGRIEQASGLKVEATRRVDPDLIGGVVLQAGTLRVDASVRGRLQRLRQELVTRS